MSIRNEMADRSQRVKQILLLSFAVMIALGVVLVSISGQSLSVDEQISYFIADKPDLISWANDIMTLRTSDIQKPSYHLYQYLWSRSFGLSELSMRLANAPWLLIAIVITAFSFRRVPLLAVCVIFASACHPLVWFYMNDAQPYAMVCATTMLCCAGVYGFYNSNQKPYSRAEKRWNLILLCVGIFLLSSATMLGVLWAGIFFLLALWFWWSAADRYQLDKIDVAIICAFFIAMTALGSLYLFSLLQGAGATRLHSTSILTIVFSVYEILGLGGLGPGRDDIRVEGLSAFVGHWPRITVGGAMIVSFMGYAATHLAKRFGLRRTLLLTGVALLPIVIVIAAGYGMNWRVLGRHIIPAAVILSYLAAFGLYHALLQKNLLARFVAAAFVASFLYSAIGYTTARHAKEDFSHAAKMASEYVARGHRVWWVANAPSAMHYGLRVSLKERNYQCTDPFMPGTALVVRNLSSDCLDTLAVPDVIFFSRPDGNDQVGTISSYIADRPYEQTESLPGFVVWRTHAATRQR